MTSLTFTQDATTGKYKASFTTGDTIPMVYIYRESSGGLFFYDSIGENEPETLHGFSRFQAGKSFRTAINTLNKAGITITIESDVAVTNAYVL